MEITRAEMIKGMGATLLLLGLGGSTASANTPVAHGVFNDDIFNAWWHDTDMGKAIDATTIRNGTKPKIVHFYGSWWSPYGQEIWPGKHLDAIVDKGCQPLFTWQPDAMGYKDNFNITPSHIARGWWDGTIREFAQRSKAWGKPLWLRIFHEADLRNHGQYVWQTGSTDDVIKAYRRTVDIFRREGAHNVKWVWNPSANQSYSALKAVFPGNDVVDYTGFDHYGDPGWNGGWKSFTENVWYPYSHLRYLSGGKQMIVGEFGQIEGRSGWKGEWIRKAMVDEIKAYFPLIRGMVYFDSWSWDLDSSTSSLSGYKSAITNPYMQGTL